MIHRDIIENKTKTNWGTLDEVNKQCPHDTSPDMMEDFVSEENVC